MVAALACEPTGPEPDYDDIRGTYAGTFQADGDGLHMEGHIMITVHQRIHVLDGPWNAIGHACDDTDFCIDFLIFGQHAGTTAEGRDPAVTLTLEDGDCPDHSETYRGTVTTDEGRLALAGTFTVLSDDCDSEVVMDLNLDLELTDYTRPRRAR